MSACLLGIKVSTSRSSTPRPMCIAPVAWSWLNSPSSRTSTKKNGGPDCCCDTTSATEHSFTCGLMLSTSASKAGLCCFAAMAFKVPVHRCQLRHQLRYQRLEHHPLRRLEVQGPHLEG